jgi:S1-C subfamily serine protease
MRIRSLILLAAAVLAGFAAARLISTGGRHGPPAALDDGRAEPAPVPSAGAGSGGAGPTAGAAAAAASPLPEPASLEGLAPEERRNIEIFRRAADSVVFITSIAYRRDFFTLDVFQIPQGTGSGFVWDRSGHVVTNYHVIEGGSAFSVTLADQTSYDAEVVGRAPDKDLAVLRIEAPASKLEPLPVGRSSGLLVGQSVLAVGNPFGLDHSLTVGVVSALGRELRAPNGRTIRDVIQTDAAINPGNSGGPLLDSGGRLIGVNSAIYSPSGASAGVGFAVPVDTVRRLVPQLIEHGRPVQPGIGAVLSESLARRFRVDGIVVYDVQPDTPAEAAGLKGLRVDRSGRASLGDRIVAVDGRPVDTLDELLHAFEEAGVGGKVRLTLEKGGQRRDVSVSLIAIE